MYNTRIYNCEVTFKAHLKLFSAWCITLLQLFHPAVESTARAVFKFKITQKKLPCFASFYVFLKHAENEGKAL
jgi:hypothetical protein